MQLQKEVNTKIYKKYAKETTENSQILNAASFS